MTDIIQELHDAAQRGREVIEPWQMDPNLYDKAAAEIERLRGEAADLQQTFDLQWEADMRAVKLWREAHPGNDLVLPDRANMVVWLLEQHAALGATPAVGGDAELREQLHYLTGTCELAMKHRDVAEHALEVALADNPTGPIDSCRWIALLERAESAEAKLAAQCAPWQTMDTAPRDGTPIMMTGVTAGGSRWFMDGEVYATGWIGGSAVGRVPNYWQPIPAFTSTECSPPKAWTEAKAEIDAGWPDDPATSD